LADDDDINSEEIITEEMLWERIPEVQGLDRANTYYELSARIYARGQYDEALALAAIELACTLGEWWFNSKEYEKTIECMNQCVQEHLVDGNDSGAANDMHLIGCAYRELKNYEKALEAFKESRALFKKLKEVINVARCDQKIAHCLTELGDAEGALLSAQKSLDVFVTAHDHRRETYSSFELGKAQIASEQYEEALMTLENVLENVTESEFKDFEFIIDIERKISVTLMKLGRLDEANEIARRLDAVVEVIDEN